MTLKTIWTDTCSHVGDPMRCLFEKFWSLFDKPEYGQDLDIRFVSHHHRRYKAQYQTPKEQITIYLYAINIENYEVMLSWFLLEELTHWGLSRDKNKDLANDPHHSVVWAETYQDIFNYIMNEDFTFEAEL